MSQNEIVLKYLEVAGKYLDLIKDNPFAFFLPKDRPVANFQVTMQEQGRFQIPQAEREALGIKRGDLVQAVVFLKKSGRK